MNGLDTSSSTTPATLQALRATRAVPAARGSACEDVVLFTAAAPGLRALPEVSPRQSGTEAAHDPALQPPSATLACARAAGMLADGERLLHVTPSRPSATMACASAASLLGETPDVSLTIARMRNTEPAGGENL
ncbi:hypothetical protein GCM10009577_37720 [Streptomyces javensis]